MLKHLAEGHTAFEDKVTLYLSDAEFRIGGIGGEISTAAHDGYRDRFVFTVEGKKFHGTGAVGVAAEFRDRNFREVGPDFPTAQHVLVAWAYCDTMGGEYDPLTLRGIPYNQGMRWMADGTIRDDISRADDYKKPLPDTAHAALRAALEKARELLLALPDTEQATVLRALRYAYQRAQKDVEEATNRRNALDQRIARLETGK